MLPISPKALEKVTCKICGAAVHIMERHLTEDHDGMKLKTYLTKYPNAEILSQAAQMMLAEKERDLRNFLVDADISKVFGVKVFSGKRQMVPAWKYPHKSTPAADGDYTFRQETLKAVLYALVCNVRVLLSGPTGSGKSSVVQQVAARLNRPFTRLQCDNDLTRADFIGQMVLRNKETFFEYGLLPTAMREGHVLLIDEWDCANPSVAAVLQAVLEGEPLTITETGEVIKPHPEFRIFATANTLGLGDETGMYHGTQPQNYAALDRFGIVLTVDYPLCSEELGVLARRVKFPETIEPKDKNAILNKFIEVANLVRKSFVNGEIMGTMSTRTLINLATLFRDFGNHEIAYKLGYLNKLTSDDRKVVLELIQRVWGTI